MGRRLAAAFPAETVHTPVTTAASVSGDRGLLCAHPETAESGRRHQLTKRPAETVRRLGRTEPTLALQLVRGSFRVASATANRGLGGGAVACRLDSGYSTPSRLASNVRTTSAPMNQATTTIRGLTEWTPRTAAITRTVDHQCDSATRMMYQSGAIGCLPIWA